MVGGSLTWYYPPSLRGQLGDSLKEELISVATPVVLESVRAGQEVVNQGQSWCTAGQAAAQVLKQGAHETLLWQYALHLACAFAGALRGGQIGIVLQHACVLLDH